MIGVVVEEIDLAAVREFFELFKSPWELYQPGKHYDVLLNSSNLVPDNDAMLVVSYCSNNTTHQSSDTQATHGPKVVEIDGERVPIYGSCLLDRRTDQLLFEKRQLPFSTKQGRQQTVVCVGYDLFQEIRYLLTVGQPPDFAETPTLELHIAILRNLIVGSRIPFVEILPVPAGYRFVVCLTHDVDHPRVRYHILDHTMFGFVYRAVVGSTIQLCRGRRTLGQLLVNWKAVMSLPFVFAGWVEDFWDQVNEYLKLEKGLASTFFVIPVRNDPGVGPHGRSEAKRAANYDLTDVADDLEKLHSANREVGVHGINAWRDVGKG